jgi:hypothetical protein
MPRLVTSLLAFGLAVTATLPAVAQQSGDQPADRNNPSAPAGAPAQADNVPEGTINKAAAALRRVSEIKQTYSQRLGGAKTQDELQTLQRQATDEAVKAIGDQGLTVDQYNQVIRQAQANPKLRDKLLAAAQASH